MCKPAGCNIGCDQYREIAVVEVTQELEPLVLRHITGERLGVEAVGLERALQPLGHALGIDEDHRAARFELAQQPDEQRQLFLHRGVVHELPDPVDRHLVRLDAHELGVVHVLVGELQDPVRQGGGKQHGLPLFRVRQAPQQIADVGDEAEIEHAVGFIQHQHLRMAHVEDVLLEVVDEASRCADEHIDAFFELPALLLVVDAAVTRRPA